MNHMHTHLLELLHIMCHLAYKFFVEHAVEIIPVWSKHHVVVMVIDSILWSRLKS
jgi:hypothetical protein